jgi:TatD DNase family protein
MKFIDTHTHLYLPEFDQDRKEMVNRAIEQGVDLLLLPNIDSSTTEAMFKMVADFPENCHPMVGLHPGSVKENWKDELATLRPLLDKPGVIAVGEIGMDLYWDKTFIEQQRLVFREQIKWAKEKNLPIVIHAREAFDEIFEILDDVIDENLSGVFHCFTGTVEQAHKILTYPNFMMGIGGVVTYKKAAMDQVLDKVPLDKLILETDAPYLSPVPFRGKRNESAYLVHSAEKLADIQGISLDELAKASTANARQIFNL